VSLFAKSARKAIPTIRFGKGFSILKEDSTITPFKDWSKMSEHFRGKRGAITHPIPISFSMDDLSVSRGGVFTAPRIGKAMMYETAFLQLLGCLELPVSIAERMPSDILISIINGLIQENFTRQATVKCVDGNIYSFSFSQSRKPFTTSANMLFDYLNSKQAKQQHKYDFLFGVIQGFRSNIVMRFSDYRDKDVGGAVEILYSDALDCRPRVTGVVATPRGHIFIRNLSFVVETDDRDSVCQMTSSFITRVAANIDSYVELYPKMEQTNLTAETVAKITQRASKCLRNYKKLKVEPGMAVSKAFDALLEHREAEKNSLLAKRDISYFGNDLLELCR